MGGVRGPFSPVRTTVFVFCVWTPAVLLTLILCMLPPLLGMMVFVDYLWVFFFFLITCLVLVGFID